MRVLVLAAVFFCCACDGNWSETVVERVRERLGHRESWTGPELDQPRILAQGVRWHELTLSGNDTAAPDRIWAALPRGEERVGCVLMAPLAMTDKLGGRLDDKDRENLVLFARLGVAAVGFDAPGIWADNATLDEVGRELDRYLSSEGGVSPGRRALDFVQHAVPRVDADKVWAVGAGMGGALALRLAERDTRIRAVVGFDPVPDLAEAAASEDLAFLVQLRPALKDFLGRHSPLAGLDRLSCPLLLARDPSANKNARKALDRFYLECLRQQKDVTLMESFDADLPDAAPQIRAARITEWLGNLNLSERP